MPTTAIVRTLEQITLDVLKQYGAVEVHRANWEIDDDGKLFRKPDYWHARTKEHEYRFFPKERLATAGIHGVGYSFDYIIYALGAIRLSIIIDTSPSVAEILASDPLGSLTEEDLRILDEDFDLTAT